MVEIEFFDWYSFVELRGFGFVCVFVSGWVVVECFEERGRGGVKL